MVKDAQAHNEHMENLRYVKNSHHTGIRYKVQHRKILPKIVHIPKKKTKARVPKAETMQPGGRVRSAISWARRFKQLSERMHAMERAVSFEAVSKPSYVPVIVEPEIIEAFDDQRRLFL